MGGSDVSSQYGPDAENMHHFVILDNLIIETEREIDDRSVQGRIASETNGQWILHERAFNPI
jgi:hypothetical protein